MFLPVTKQRVELIKFSTSRRFTCLIVLSVMTPRSVAGSFLIKFKGISGAWYDGLGYDTMQFCTHHQTTRRRNPEDPHCEYTPP